ncbi:MAG: DUF2971 domain-containing protein [Atopobiaceae bacterium]|nr:DUF2971 domain-containing protein [Atopobiaceae bacterium]
MGAPYGRAFKTLRLSVHGHAPGTLYKYFNVENASRSIQDLRKGLLYLASPKDFDDDYDVRPQYNADVINRRMNAQVTPQNIADTFKFLGQFLPSTMEAAENIHNEMVRRAGGFGEFKKEYIDETIVSLPKRIEAFRNSVRCACLAEEQDSDLMWGLYASKHKGFVAAYNTPLSTPACSCVSSTCPGSACERFGFPLTLIPVLYKGRKDISDYSDVYGGSTSLIPYLTEHLYLAVVMSTAYKGARWEMEREWRLVTLTCNRADGSTMYARMTPTALYLGSKISVGHEAKLIEVAQELRIPVYKEVVTYEASSDAMVFEQVPPRRST